MILASFVLASTLSQPYPPPSRYDPPPCVVARVPGCREGYRMRQDAFGRTIFVYDPTAAADQPPVPPPPQMPDPYMPEQPPVYAAPAAPAAQPDRSRGQFGLVWMPLGGTSFGSWKEDQEWSEKYAGLLALELRGQTGGARLRFVGEYGPVIRVGEIGLKYDFNDRGVLRPFLGVGVGAAKLDEDYGFDPRWCVALSGSVGLDFYLTRNLFFTGELKGRGFFERTDSAPTSSNLAQFAAFFGAGIYF
jgi:hypothetical protein